MYYDDDSVSNYYSWYKKSKELEKMRKRKKKLEEKRKKKLAREKAILERRAIKKEIKETARLQKIETRTKTLEELRKVGYKPSWTKRNPLKVAKNSRDPKLCQEIYEKAKSGQSTYSLAKEYDMHPNTILRHKYEYEYYLGVKGIDKELNI